MGVALRGEGGVSCFARGREGELATGKEGVAGAAYASNLRGPVGETT